MKILNIVFLTLMMAFNASAQRGQIIHANDDYVPKSYELTFLRDSDSSIRHIIPELTISSIDQLDEWIEINGNIVLAYFESGNVEPQFTISEKMIHYLVVTINDSDRNTYALVGHTHSQGSKKDNMNLSLRRSGSVYEYLVNKFHLDLSKMPVLGEGETKPLNDNTTIENRFLNSRVELKKMK